MMQSLPTSVFLLFLGLQLISGDQNGFNNFSPSLGVRQTDSNQQPNNGQFNQNPNMNGQFPSQQPGTNNQPFPGQTPGGSNQFSNQPPNNFSPQNQPPMTNPVSNQQPNMNNPVPGQQSNMNNPVPNQQPTMNSQVPNQQPNMNNQFQNPTNNMGGQQFPTQENPQFSQGPNPFNGQQVLPSQTQQIPQNFIPQGQMVPYQGQYPQTSQIQPQVLPQNLNYPNTGSTLYPQYQTYPNSYGLNLTPDGALALSYINAQLSNLLNDPIGREGLLFMVNGLRTILSNQNSLPVIQEIVRRWMNALNLGYGDNSNLFGQTLHPGSFFDMLKKKGAALVNFAKDLTTAKAKAFNSIFDNTPASSFARYGTNLVDGLTTPFLGTNMNG